MKKPRLLFYCQHSLGIGHLTRSFALVRALGQKFQVVFLNGGPLPDGLPRPRGVEIVDLPPLGMTASGGLLSRDSTYDVALAKTRRRELILQTFARFLPDVVVIELFPFGRKKFAGELLPLLKLAHRRRPHRSRVFCSLRDILVNNRKDQQRHDDRAAWLVNRYFDGIVLHADPSFVRLEESFSPRYTLRVPLHYTGFILPERERKEPSLRGRDVLVSAGGGIVGGALFRLALAAQGALWHSHDVRMRVVAGPFLPENEWVALVANAEKRPGLELHRSVPDMGIEMLTAGASVSQCGYNTAMDILYAGVPALVIPFADGIENEQTHRATRLAELGLVRVLSEQGARPDVFVDEVAAMLNTTPVPASLDVDGAHMTTQLIADSVVRS